MAQNQRQNSTHPIHNVRRRKKEGKYEDKENKFGQLKTKTYIYIEI